MSLVEISRLLVYWDSAAACSPQPAAQVAARLALDDGAGREPEVRFYATDSVEKFRALGTRFLGRAIDDVDLVNLDP